MFYFLSNSPYIAIIGDIKRSKKLRDRNVVQKQLEKVLCEVNEKYKNDIASRFMITLGDEFQGLLISGENVMNIIFEIEAKMYPVEIRFGVGIGDITTDINPDIPLGADGPAYYNARNSIEHIKNNEKRSKSAESSIVIKIAGDNKAAEELLNTILSLMSVIKNKWTDRQREVIFDYIEHGDSQKDTATRLGITQSSVQKNLSGAYYYSYKEAMNTVSKSLSEIRGKTDV